MINKKNMFLLNKLPARSVYNPGKSTKGSLTAVILYKLVDLLLSKTKPHLLTLDAITRFALIVAGAFGSYSLGANNIANVMGVFVEASPFHSSVSVCFRRSGINACQLWAANYSPGSCIQLPGCDRGSYWNRVAGKIAFGWVTTPAIALVLSFTSIILVQNLFMVEVFEPSLEPGFTYSVNQ